MQDKQWYVSVNALAANRGHNFTQCSWLACPYFRVSLKQTGKAKWSYVKSQDICMSRPSNLRDLTHSTWRGPPAVCSSADRCEHKHGLICTGLRRSSARTQTRTGRDPPDNTRFCSCLSQLSALLFPRTPPCLECRHAWCFSSAEIRCVFFYTSFILSCAYCIYYVDLFCVANHGMLINFMSFRVMKDFEKSTMTSSIAKWARLKCTHG